MRERGRVVDKKPVRARWITFMAMVMKSQHFSHTGIAWTMSLQRNKKQWKEGERTLTRFSTRATLDWVVVVHIDIKHHLPFQGNKHYICILLRLISVRDKIQRLMMTKKRTGRLNTAPMSILVGLSFVSETWGRCMNEGIGYLYEGIAKLLWRWEGSIAGIDVTRQSEGELAVSEVVLVAWEMWFHCCNTSLIEYEERVCAWLLHGLPFEHRRLHQTYSELKSYHNSATRILALPDKGVLEK